MYSSYNTRFFMLRNNVLYSLDHVHNELTYDAVTMLD